MTSPTRTLKSKLTGFLSSTPPPVTASKSKPSTSKPSKSTNNIAQAYTYKDITGTTSTSTTPLPEGAGAAKPQPKKVSPKKEVKKPVSFEQGCKEWFAEFQDADEEGKMDGDGVERLFEDMGVSMEGPLPFILAWKVNAKPGTFGSFYLSDFLTAFREPKINSSPLLKSYLNTVSTQLFPKPPTPANLAASKADFTSFYKFLFPFMKDQGQKSLAGGMAVAVWGVVLTPRFTLAKEFVEYAESLGEGFKGVSPDVWHQLLEFLHTVGDDASGYREEDAWPAVLDSFVEWRAAKTA